MAILVAAILVTWSLIDTDAIWLNRVAWMLAGVVVGRIVRDLVWLGSVAENFLFLKKVLDWERVEELARIPEDTE